ncbi:MAG: PAS domain S-box protein [Candidatus Dormiibacterota bacterium]
MGRPVTASDDAFTRKDGSILPVAYSASPLVYAGAVDGVVVVFRDITEEKSELQRAHGELAALGRGGCVMRSTKGGSSSDIRRSRSPSTPTVTCCQPCIGKRHRLWTTFGLQTLSQRQLSGALPVLDTQGHATEAVETPPPLLVGAVLRLVLPLRASRTPSSPDRLGALLGRQRRDIPSQSGGPTN